MSKRFIQFTSLIILISLSLSACSTKEELREETKASKVQVQSLEESLELSQALEYSGIISASVESKIIAKSSGILEEIDFNLGSELKSSKLLAKIKEIGSSTNSSASFDSSQIKQASIALEQASLAYQSARLNYDNIVLASDRDLEQAKLARDQVSSGQGNLEFSFSENLKSAKLALETAELASQQARANLENQKKEFKQARDNALKGAEIASSGARAVAGASLTGINNIAAFDDNNVVKIEYQSNLGALNFGLYNRVKNDYKAAKEFYESYIQKEDLSTAESLNQAILLIEKIKALSDDTKLLLDKTTSSVNLPQSSMQGPSLSSLQGSISSIQAQVNASVSQVNSAKQALAALDLNTSSALEALESAYEIAKRQESSARQNLNNLEANRISQSDQLEFSYLLADSQYNGLKLKLNSQILGAKAQLDNALAQYNNASLNLESLQDAYSILAPIDGVITQKFVNEGDLLAPGQVLALISQLDNLKIKIFLEAEYLNDLSLGQVVKIISRDNKTHSGYISSIASQADALSKRFQVDIALLNTDDLLLGTIAKVQFNIIKQVENPKKQAILPLSALEIGQSKNYLSIFQDSRLLKLEFDLIKLYGEYALIEAELPQDALFILSGHKFLEEGDLLSLE